MWSNDRFSSMRTTILLIERSGLLAMAILLAGGFKLHDIRSPPRTMTPANAQCTPDGGLKKLSATLKGKEDPHPSYAPMRLSMKPQSSLRMLLIRAMVAICSDVSLDNRFRRTDSA